MDAFFIFSAKYLFLAPIALLALYFLLRSWPEKKSIATFALPALILTYRAALVGGQAYFDARPFVEAHFTPLIPHIPDNGFPSDHALLVSAVAAIGSYLNWRLGAALWVLAFIVAAARVYVGLHHPIDVLGSAAIAIISTSIWYFWLPRAKHGKTA